MFLRAATLLLLSLSSFASAIDVTMIDMEDVLENHRIVTDSSKSYGPSYARGVSTITSKLKNLLAKTANQDIGACAASIDTSEWHEVQTTFLSGTSNYHQDHKHNDGTLVEEEVGLIVLNTNSDAYFDHPDMKVPIREGAFIRFNGSDPHRTVVNKGNVHLLGPFDIKSFGKVGSSFGPTLYCCTSASNFCEPTNEEGGSPCPGDGTQVSGQDYYTDENTCSLSCPHELFWETRASFPGKSKYTRSQGALVDDDFFLISSDGTVDQYDVQDDEWSQVIGIWYGKSSYAHKAVALDDSIHVISHDWGAGRIHRVMTPSVSTSTWNDAPVYEISNEFTGAPVAVGDKIYVFGDSYSSCGATDEIFVYDPSTPGWTTLHTKMIQPRSYSTATLVGTKVYIIGKDWCSDEGPMMEVFDTETSVSSIDGIDQTKIPFTFITYHSAVVLDNMIYVMGGYQKHYANIKIEISDKVWRYNIVEDEWLEMPHLPTAVFFLETFTYGREIFAVGGRDPQYDSIESTYALYIEAEPSSEPSAAPSALPSASPSDVPSLVPSGRTKAAKNAWRCDRIANGADPDTLKKCKKTKAPVIDV